MPAYDFELNFIDEDEYEGIICDGQIIAENDEIAKQKIIENHWDERFDSASCIPSIALDEIDHMDDLEHLEIGKSYTWIDSENNLVPETVTVISVDDDFIFCRNQKGAIEDCKSYDLFPI